MPLHLVFFLVLLALLASGSERWKLQYHYDEDQSALTVNDLKFPTPSDGIAVGYLEENGKLEPAELMTGDGGLTWKLLKPPEIGISVFCLNKSAVWMVGKDHLWRSVDGGARWSKLKRPTGISRVFFKDEETGWAVGAKKGFYETSDGGKQWTRVPAADKPHTNPEHTVYNWIEFAGPKGIVTGSSRPPRKSSSSTPDWADPESARRRPEWPSTVIFLQTVDGGKTWSTEESSVFGEVTRVRTAADGRGLGLLEYLNFFEFPSEVFMIRWRTGSGEPVFRRKDRAITDVAIFANGAAFVAGVEVQGTLPKPLNPSKVKILRSEDLKAWTQIPVDYRAVATRVTLAAADSENIWAATDTGMILKLVAE